MKLIDITGQVFGRLTVLRKHPKPCLWECLCTCEGLTLVTGTNLRRGNTTSCGCVHREQLVAFNKSTKSIRESWLADMNLYVRKVGYRRNRQSKGLGSNQFSTRERLQEHADHPSFRWDLSLDQYIELVTSDCYYCGLAPQQTPKGVCMAPNLKRNGIDRKDNTQGYLFPNCVPCCSFCNREKRAQTVEQFLENTRRRYEHLVLTGVLTTSSSLPSSEFSDT